MKKITVTVSFDEEKLSALKMYLEQKGQTVEEELEKSLTALYQKGVPVGVREFLDLRSGAHVSKVRHGKSSSSSVVGTEKGEADG